MKLHVLCSTYRVPVSYELTAANVAEFRLIGELLGGARLGEDLARSWGANRPRSGSLW